MGGDVVSMENKRALRRAHVARLKASRRDWWGRKLSAEDQGRAVHTPRPCSCWMCGNPRKYFGERTVQERRAMQDI